MASAVNNSVVKPSPAIPAQGVASPVIDPKVAKLEHDLRALSPQIRELIQRVEKMGKFTIALVDDRPGGAFVRATRQVLINKNLQHNLQLSYIIFELLNAEKHTEVFRVDREARLGMHTKETYGEAIERIEFENTITHHALVQGLPKEFDLYSWVSFPEYLQTAIKTGHINAYYQMYERCGLCYLDWSRRNDPVERLVGDLRAMPKNIIERIRTVEKLLGKFPAIVLVEDDDTPTSYYQPSRKLIHLNKNLSHNKQLAYLLFELLTIERCDDLSRVYEEASRGLHTEKSFGAAFEKITYENSVTHHHLVQGLSPDMDITKWCRSTSLTDYLKESERQGHQESFYQIYRNRQFRHAGPVPAV